MAEWVGAFLVERGRLLLGKRARHKSFAGCWDVIGGHVEPGETLVAALRRELSEELGIDAAAGTWLETVAIARADGSTVPLHLHRVSSWRGVPTRRNDEHDELRWFGLAEAAALPGLACGDYRRILTAMAGVVDPAADAR